MMDEEYDHEEEAMAKSETREREGKNFKCSVCNKYYVREAACREHGNAKHVPNDNFVCVALAQPAAEIAPDPAASGRNARGQFAAVAKHGEKVAAGAAVTDELQHVADLPGDAVEMLLECQCWYSTDFPVCGTRWNTYSEVIQHYWCDHPHALNGGIKVMDVETGEVFQPDADYVPMSVDVVTFLKAVVPEEYCEDAFMDAYQWLQSFLNNNGDENGRCNISCDELVQEYSNSFTMQKNDTSLLSPSPAREAAKKRRCSACKQFGHQKNSRKCSMKRDDSLLLTPDSKRSGSVNISPRTPPTV
jgi:hypothetical protein